jgi:hypothetical protein
MKRIIIFLCLLTVAAAGQGLGDWPVTNNTGSGLSTLDSLYVIGLSRFGGLATFGTGVGFKLGTAATSPTLKDTLEVRVRAVSAMFDSVAVTVLQSKSGAAIKVAETDTVKANLYKPTTGLAISYPVTDTIRMYGPTAGDTLILYCNGVSTGIKMRSGTGSGDIYLEDGTNTIKSQRSFAGAGFISTATITTSMGDISTTAANGRAIADTVKAGKGLSISGNMITSIDTTAALSTVITFSNGRTVTFTSAKGP